MNHIKENTIGEAWSKAIALLLATGKNVSDDKGIILETLSLTIHITDPIPDDKILEQYGSEEVLHFMEKNFRDFTAVDDWNYSYAQRLYNYKGANQITNVIQILQQNMLAKSATISLLDIDNDNYHKPCLVSLDFKIRNSILFLTGFFRSQDVGKKMYADSLELVHIGNLVAKQLSILKVEIILFISSAHIYEEDFPKILDILKDQTINKKND